MMTVGKLRKIIKDCPDDMPVYMQGFEEITDINVSEISDRHSREWMKPKRFVMIYNARRFE